MMSKTRVIDRQAFLVDERISPRMSLTPEGYLLCKDVPIARIGKQLYSEDEINVPGSDDQIVGKNGVVVAERYEEEVFSEQTMASFEGKPVTIDHPDGFVGPGNWRQLTVGTVNNVRRGEGLQSDLLIADLLITDQEGIDAIQTDGIRQVSCGYDTKYEQLAPGHAAQRDIVGNHVAIVPRGRAGERCSIGDNMSKKVTLMDKLKHFLKDNAEEIVEQQIEEQLSNDDDGEYQERLSNLEGAIAALQAKMEEVVAMVGSKSSDEEEVVEEMVDEESEELEEEVEDEDEEEEKSKGTTDSMRNVMAKAEIIAPGFRPHTRDSKKPSTRAVKVQALSAAYKTADGSTLIKKLLGGKQANFAKMSNDGLSILFNSAFEAMREKNNSISFSSNDAYQSRDHRGMSIIKSMNEVAAKLRS